MTEVASSKKVVVCRRRGRVEMALPCPDSCGAHHRFCSLDGKRCGLAVLPARLLYGCSFLVGVQCPFKLKDGGFVMLDQCESCEHYIRFNREMEEEDRAVDEEALREEGRF